MSAYELGGTVNHDVGTMLQGTKQVGSGECVVDNQRDAMTMSHCCHALDVQHVTVRITEGLCIDGLGVGKNGSLQCLQVVHLDDCICDSLVSQRVSYKVERPSVQVVGCHKMVACREDVL